MIITLIKHLVEKEGITVPSSPVMGLQVPMDGFDLWVAKLNQESYSPRTTNPVNGVKSIKARKQERELPAEEQIKKLLTYRYYRKEQGQRFQLLVLLLITNRFAGAAKQIAGIIHRTPYGLKSRFGNSPR